MSFIKFLFILSLIIIVNCSGNKVTNYHGTKSLDIKFNEIIVHKTNKNDLIRIFGPPSTKSDFDTNKWFYVERLKTNQSLLRLGTQKIQKNNIIVIELNKKGILKSKKFYNLDDMNDLKHLKEITNKEFKNSDVIYGVISSLREKINAPLRNRKK